MPFVKHLWGAITLCGILSIVFRDLFPFLLLDWCTFIGFELALCQHFVRESFVVWFSWTFGSFCNMVCCLMRANELLDAADISTWARSRLSKDAVPHNFLSQTDLLIMPGNKIPVQWRISNLCMWSLFSHYPLIYMSSTIREITVSGVWEAISSPDTDICFRMSYSWVSSCLGYLVVDWNGSLDTQFIFRKRTVQVKSLPKCSIFPLSTGFSCPYPGVKCHFKCPCRYQLAQGPPQGGDRLSEVLLHITQPLVLSLRTCIWMAEFCC